MFTNRVPPGSRSTPLLESQAATLYIQEIDAVEYRFTGIFTTGEGWHLWAMLTTTMATLLLVDDQAILLDGLEALLGTMPGLDLAGRCTNGKDAVEIAGALLPDVVIMDVNMPGMDGIEATKRLLKVSPKSRVLILSMYGHKEFVREAMDAGAFGYLLKNAGKEDLRKAIEDILDGHKHIAPEIERLLHSGDLIRDRRGEIGYHPLSKRELQIVKLIMAEHTTQEIAGALFISTDTVETHRRNIMHKLDVRNTAGVVKYAMERGWNTN